MLLDYSLIILQYWYSSEDRAGVWEPHLRSSIVENDHHPLPKCVTSHNSRTDDVCDMVTICIRLIMQLLNLMCRSCVKYVREHLDRRFKFKSIHRIPMLLVRTLLLFTYLCSSDLPVAVIDTMLNVHVWIIRDEKHEMSTCSLTKNDGRILIWLFDRNSIHQREVGLISVDICDNLCCYRR